MFTPPFYGPKVNECNGDVTTVQERRVFQPDELVDDSGFSRRYCLTARLAHRKFLVVGLKVLDCLHSAASAQTLLSDMHAGEIRVI